MSRICLRTHPTTLKREDPRIGISVHSIERDGAPIMTPFGRDGDSPGVSLVELAPRENFWGADCYEYATVVKLSSYVVLQPGMDLASIRVVGSRNY